jgi:hypothetical protein
MSQQLISRNPDLKRLRDEGYDVSVRENHLVMRGMPYVDAQREVRVGTLISTLHLAGETTQRPDTHVIYFAGAYPCDEEGRPIEGIRHASGSTRLGAELSAWALGGEHRG